MDERIIAPYMAEETSPETADYYLGTDTDEIERLGLQHRVWQPATLKCWREAGITSGSKVVDIGSGPGYALFDLAQIVGPQGRVVGIERSTRFVDRCRQLIEEESLSQATLIDADLMDDLDLPRDFDFAWCRWVATFVPSPARLIEQIGRWLRPGGRAIFHEYSAYSSWRMGSRTPKFDAFVAATIAHWREAGGEPDIALDLPPLLTSAGFRTVAAEPVTYVTHPGDYVWQWPRAFTIIHSARMVELGIMTEPQRQELLAEFLAAERDPSTLMTTPVVIQIIAEKVGGVE